MAEIEREKLHTHYDPETGSHEVISQPLYMSSPQNITSTADHYFIIKNVCKSNIIVFDTLQHIVEQRNEEGVEACFPAKCKYASADFLMEPNPLKLNLEQVGGEVYSIRNTFEGLGISVPGGEWNFPILIRTKKIKILARYLAASESLLQWGPRTLLTFGSSDNSARDCLASFSLHPILCTGGGLLLVHRLMAHIYCSLGRAQLNVGSVFVKRSACHSYELFMFGGLRRLGSAEDSYPQILDDGDNKGTWSLLPVLLLWMIKDKLDIFDNMRLAVVCRDWWSASASYPKRLQTVGDGLPWILQVTDKKSSVREFMSVTRKRKFTIDMPEFREGYVLFSKQGWILLRRGNFWKSRERLPDCLFLINPFTKGTIKLPDVVDPSLCYAGTFSTHEGYPHCVVLLEHGKGTPVSVRIAYPGDEVWTFHTYFGQRRAYMGYGNLITIGQFVYCYDGWGRMIIYNIASDSWKEVPLPEGKSLGSYITEHNGEIMKIDPDGSFNFNSSSRVFRYNDADTAWERLNNDAVDTSWFLSRGRNGFSAKEKGLRVYSLYPRGDKVGSHYHSKFVVRDLIAGSTETIHLPYPPRAAAWVDIG